MLKITHHFGYQAGRVTAASPSTVDDLGDQHDYYRASTQRVMTLWEAGRRVPALDNQAADLNPEVGIVAVRGGHDYTAAVSGPDGLQVEDSTIRLHAVTRSGMTLIDATLYGEPLHMLLDHRGGLLTVTLTPEAPTECNCPDPNPYL